jgi:hypothetical protein
MIVPINATDPATSRLSRQRFPNAADIEVGGTRGFEAS